MTESPAATGPLMVDAVNFGNIPNGAFRYAAGYLNGRFATPESQLDRFDGIIRIGVLGGDPTQARFARVLDVETHDATPSDCPAFIMERQRAGHNDATIYCNRDTFPSVIKACAGLKFRIWLATLDGTRINEFMGHPLWAVQYETVSHDGNQLYDVSELFGTLDFTKP